MARGIWVDRQGRSHPWTGHFHCCHHVGVYKRELSYPTAVPDLQWTNAVYASADNHCRESGNCPITVKFGIAKWVFCGCIWFSFLLLGWEMYRASRVIKTRDISYCFTNVMANRWVSVRDYNKFCLFRHIGESKKKKDSLAFFVFFSFQDWKRVILSDGPRQSINALILYTIAKNFNFSFDYLPQYWDNSTITALLFWAMVTTVVLFAFGLAKILISGALYLPLLCYIKGNLKEYVCHKVDKRLGKVMRNIQRDRLKRNAKIEQQLAMGGKVKVATGEIVDAALLRPTLPNISLNDDDIGSKTNLLRSASPVGSAALPPGGRVSPGPNWGVQEKALLTPGGRVSPGPNWAVQEKPPLIPGGRVSPGPNWGMPDAPPLPPGGRVSPSPSWGAQSGGITQGPQHWNASEISLTAPPVQPANLDDIYDSYSIDDHDSNLGHAVPAPGLTYPPNTRRLSPPQAAAAPGAPTYPPSALGPAPPYPPPSNYPDTYPPTHPGYGRVQPPQPPIYGRPLSPAAGLGCPRAQSPVMQREHYEYSAGSLTAVSSGNQNYVEATIATVARTRQSHGW